jgi:hypothetical protein
MIARKPTPTCLRTPASPPSVTSDGTLRVLIWLDAHAENRNVAALKRKAISGEDTASTAAPIAGPAMTDAFSIMLSSEFAAARCRSPTTCGVIAAVAG